MNILRVKNSQGNWIDIPAIVGPPGRQGDPGAPGAKGDRGDTVIVASRYEDLTFPVTAGTYCLYANKPYVAKTDIPATESWTAAHWDAVSFEDEIGDLKSAFGSMNTALTNIIGYGTPLPASPVIAEGLNIVKNGTAYRNESGRITQYIPVTKGKECSFNVTAAKSAEFRFAFSELIPAASIDALYLGDITTSTTDTFSYTPQTDGYVSMSYYHDALSSLKITSVSIGIGDIEDSTKSIKEELDGKYEEMSLSVVSGLNYKANGTKYESSSNYTTQYIPVKAGKNYTFTVVNDNSTGYYRFVMADKVPANNVLGSYISELSISGAAEKTYTVTAPQNGCLSISYNTSVNSSVSVIGLSDGIKSDLNEINTSLSGVEDAMANLDDNVETLINKNRPTDVIALDSFVQGSIYNGTLDKSNPKCISTESYINIHKNILLSAKISQANGDGTSWNVRFSFYNANEEYVGQNGYSVWNGEFTSVIPTSAELMKISMSLLEDDTNPNITPADYTANRLVTVTLAYMQAYATLDEIGAIPQGLIKYRYSGEELSYTEHEIAFVDFMQLSGITSISGSAVYGDYLFTANNSMSKIAVTDMRNKTQVATIEFTAVSTYHCNVVNFGTEKYDNADDFPLMYISMENASEHKAIVMRIQHSGNVFTATQVQTITYPTNTDAGMYYQNCFIDNGGGYMYVAGSTLNDYHSGNGNKLKVKKYALPLLSAGDVQLTNADVLNEFEVDLLTAPQGGFIANGKLVQTCGLGSSDYPDVRICMIDLINGKTVTNILLNNYGITTEQESAFVWDGGLYIMTNGGKITRVYT